MNVFSDRIKNLQPSVIREMFKFTADPSVISFSAGNPAPEAFPLEKIAELSDEILRQEPVNALQYSITEGYPKLREWLKSDMLEKGLFEANGDELVITSGAQQVMELVTKTICNEGETIICEAPSFIGSLNCFRSYGAKLVGVSMDDEGIALKALETALSENRRSAFIYLIPNFQNPTGKTMSLKRRKEVLELAYKYNVIILEDNPYGELRFAGVDLPSIKSMDKKGMVIYAGTFSKTLAPGLRVGYMIGPENIVNKAVAAMQVSTVHTNIWAQMLVYRFLTKVDFNEHIEKLREIYKRKCDLMLNSLKFSMPLSIGFTEPEGGLFIWGTLPYGDLASFCRAALDKKVAIVPGNAFLVDEREKSLSFRLNFSTPSEEQIEKGVEILAEVTKKYYN
ncbi:MAG: PLP-dependent aminotransferase family protein [Eubacterium sp.]|nr:PLP-dependent aminotransferase family protein [Eubacterium sp.]